MFHATQLMPGTGTRTTAASTPRGSTILLVDDDPALRRVLGKILSRSGFQVLAASSGAEALEMFRHHDGPVHAAICDLLLPGMGGWALSERLHELKPALPVLFMSGYDLPSVMEKGMVPPAMAMKIDLLQKPFAAGELTVRLSALLEEGPGQR